MGPTKQIFKLSVLKVLTDRDNPYLTNFWIDLLLTLLLTESAGEVCGEGDSSGIRFGHDSVQGTEAAGKSWAAEVRRRGHNRRH